MHEIQFHINIHIYVEFVLCIVVVLTTLYPMSLGTMLYLISFRYTRDALEACLFLKEGVFSTLFIGAKLGWSWTLISYIDQCHLGNKYLPHAYISSFQPCVGCILAWFLCVAIHMVFAIASSKNVFIANMGMPGWLHIKWIIHNHFHDSYFLNMLI